MTSPVKIGKIYLHPEDGPIRIDSGDYTVNGRISNFWYWTILSSGEENHGYGSHWPDISDQYVTIQSSSKPITLGRVTPLRILCLTYTISCLGIATTNPIKLYE